MEPGEFLRAHAPFDRLAPDQVRAIEEALEIVYQPRGAAVLRQGGAPSRHLYVIRKGAVRLEREGRVEQLIEVGECFGFPSLIGKASPHADAIAVEDCLLYQVPGGLFDRLMETASFREFFLLDLSERLRRAADTEPSAFGADLALPARHLCRGAITRVPATTSVGDAARLMRKARISSVLVDGDPEGILTDRDFRNRVLAEGRGPDTLVEAVASRPLRTLPADATLFEALVFMLENDVHHVPLADGSTVIGMLTDTDLLRLQGRSPLGVRAALDEDVGDTAALADYGREIGATVSALVGGGLEAAKIGRIVARLNDALVGRLLRRAEVELGPPPVAYAWMVYGSEGRMEQALLTDQDNAIVYRDVSTDGDPPAAVVEEYFAALARKVVDGLCAATFPPCPGGFMATRWCKPLSAWQEQFRGWIATPDAAALLDLSSLFDFRAVHGTLDLSPLEAVVRGAAERGVFLAHLARTALAFEPPLSPFRQIREEEGGVDLKRGGLMPIVGMARVYALAAGSSARSTLDRLAAAAAAGTLSRDGAGTLTEAFRFLLSLRLRAQLEALRLSSPTTNVVRPDELSALERRLLRDTFLAVRELQQATALRFQTERLG